MHMRLQGQMRSTDVASSAVHIVWSEVDGPGETGFVQTAKLRFNVAVGKLRTDSLNSDERSETVIFVGMGR